MYLKKHHLNCPLTLSIAAYFLQVAVHLLHGIDQLLADELKVPVFISDNPLDCVAIGTGILLENMDKDL